MTPSRAGWDRHVRTQQAAGRRAAAVVDNTSAARPSPFTPIAEYALLSECHTDALVALDGSVDWLCVRRFDSPGISASLLD